ncbi:MAG: polysaccharide biosynthesis C-terminal domain-containing protein, partial [Saprospiraceae bacterium]
LALLISLFTQAYRYAAEPFFFRHAAEKNALQIQANATKWFTIAAAAGMLGILLFLDLLKGFIGEDFREGLHVVPILLLANVLLGVYYNFSVWYRLKDRTVLGAWISAAGAVVTLVLNLWWVPRMGYAGAAWATLACYFFVAWATWQTGRREYPAPYPLGRMAAYLGAAVAIAGLHLGLKIWLPELPSPVFLGAGAVFFGVFLGLVWVWEKEELRRLKF